MNNMRQVHVDDELFQERLLQWMVRLLGDVGFCDIWGCGCRCHIRNLDASAVAPYFFGNLFSTLPSICLYPEFNFQQELISSFLY